MAASTGARLLDWLDARSAEAVAVVALCVMVLGVAVVAEDRQGEGDSLQGAAPTSTPTSPAPVTPTSEPSLRLAPPVPGPVTSAPATSTPTPAAPTPAPTTTATASSSASASDLPDRRVVVLGVDAPTSVRAGQSVTFTVSVRAVGGTPVLSGARFGDGSDGGVPAPCAGLAGPSFTGDLTVSHTYATAGTYAAYFVATIPCGPESGAGTQVTVTGSSPGPTGSPTATPSTTASPTATATPSATATPTP